MFRVLLLMLISFLFTAVPAQQEASAQNIFLTPNKNKSTSGTDKPSTAPIFVVPKKNSSSSSSQPSTGTSSFYTYQSSSNSSAGGAPTLPALPGNMNMDGFDIFNQLGGSNLGLSSSDVPQSEEEMLQMAAALNVPVVADVLQYKRLLEVFSVGSATNMTGRVGGLLGLDPKLVEKAQKFAESEIGQEILAGDWDALEKRGKDAKDQAKDALEKAKEAKDKAKKAFEDFKDKNKRDDVIDGAEGDLAKDTNDAESRKKKFELEDAVAAAEKAQEAADKLGIDTQAVDDAVAAATALSEAEEAANTNMTPEEIRAEAEAEFERQKAQRIEVRQQEIADIKADDSNWRNIYEGRPPKLVGRELMWRPAQRVKRLEYEIEGIRNSQCC